MSHKGEIFSFTRLLGFVQERRIVIFTDKGVFSVRKLVVKASIEVI